MLGIGERYEYHGSKLPLVKHELEMVKNRQDILVMFTDAYDVITFGNSTKIIDIFQSFEANVVFGAEYFCFPDKFLQNQFPLNEKGKGISMLL